MRHLNLSRDVVPYHSRIFDRILASDAEGARQAMEEHLAQVLRNHQDSFGS